MKEAKKVFLLVSLLLAVGASIYAEDGVGERVPAELNFKNSDMLDLSWQSRSNFVYRLRCRTNLLQTLSVVLKEDIFPTAQTNQLSLYSGGVESAFLEVEVQDYIQDALTYDLVSPSGPTFVGTFCVTNATQFNVLKDELGLAEHEFDFTTDVVIGVMEPRMSSITGHYQMQSVYETSETIFVCYQYYSFYPNSSPAFHKETMVVKTQHRNKPVRLIYLGTVFSGDTPAWLKPIISIDPEHSPYPGLPPSIL